VVSSAKVGKESDVAKVILVSFFDEYALGIRYIASSLLAAGHQVQLTFLRQFARCHPVESQERNPDEAMECPFPVTRSDVEYFVQQVESFCPDLVGITLVSTLFGLACTVTQLLHQRLPNVPVIWGGIEPTASPEVAQEHADIVCVGEGESAMVELAAKVPSKSASTGGPWWFEIDGPIVNLRIRSRDGWLRSEEGLMVQDLESLPFPLFDLNRELCVTDGVLYQGSYPPDSRLQRSIPVLTGRGCVFQCSYCGNSILRKLYHGGTYYRRRSPEKVIDEIKLRVKQFPNLRVIEIEDDVFTLERNWTERFADLYRDIRIPFWCYTYPGFRDESVLRRLLEVGLISVTFGIQSGSERVLREVYNRRATLQGIRDTAEVLHRLGIPYVVDLIGSNPLETDEDRAKSVELLASLPKPYLLHPINPMTFYRNYPITDLALQEGVTLVQSPGTTKFGPEPNQRYLAWDAIMTLAQYPGIDAEMLKPLWENPVLMNDPKALLGLAKSFALAVYCHGDIYCTKDKRLKDLERQLAALQGSRLVRVALQVRNFLSRLR